MRIRASFLVVACTAVATACAGGPSSGLASQGEIATATWFGDADPVAAWSSMELPRPRIPAWAAGLAPSLPATTAAHINLDFVQRTQNPLGPVLGAELRWVVADALRCDYVRDAAEADLQRAGVPADRIRRLGDPEAQAPRERRIFEFARKLTHDGAGITDAEVAELIGAEGPDDAVAIVHVVAYVNFHARIVHALGLVEEPGGAVQPLAVRAASVAETQPAPRPPAPAAPQVAIEAAAPRPAWSQRSYGDLRTALEEQRSRAAPDRPAR